MMKFRFIEWGLALLLVVSVSNVMANVAPVESLTTENTQSMPDSRASNVDNTASTQQAPVASIQNATTAAPAPAQNPYSAPTKDNASSEAPRPQQQQYTDNVSATQPMVSQEGSSGSRVARLEQQMANMAQMNLPEQISGLRQEIQQLNGRLQMQQHDIQMLSNQQRSFYQDLNHRVQRLIGAGATSPSDANNGLNHFPASTASNAGMNDSKAYRSAFDALVKKRYPAAIQGFKAYLDSYPRGAFVANAYYWLGEIYLKQNDPKKAEQSFNAVINKFPKSNKVSDAKLKLAIIHINSGKLGVGRRELQTIKRQYPGSTAAQLASIQLQRMQ